MEESSTCRIGVKSDMLCKSQSMDSLQHRDSNPGGRSNKLSVEEDEGNNFVTKNRSLVSPVYCTHGSRGEPAGPEDGMDPSSSQQDSECKRNKGKSIGNN